MKRMTVGGLLIIGLGASLALGQYYGGAYIDNSASTVGESYARGMADVVRSQGAANVMNSQAAINMTEAARRDMENREQWTDTYFQMRQKNKEYRAAEKRPRATREDWVRYAAAGKPEATQSKRAGFRHRQDQVAAGADAFRVRGEPHGPGSPVCEACGLRRRHLGRLLADRDNNQVGRAGTEKTWSPRSRRRTTRWPSGFSRACPTRTACLRAERPCRRLAFRELGAAPCPAETVLLALFHPGVAGQEPLGAKSRLELRVHDFQGSGDSELAGVRLAGQSAAVNADHHVDLSANARDAERGKHRLALLLIAEELIERPLVDQNLSLTAANPDPGRQNSCDAPSRGNRPSPYVRSLLLTSRLDPV
jgi:hypothetical protein